MRTLRFELKRAFTNPLFFVASFISIGIIVCHIVFSVIPDSAEQGMYLETVRHPLNVFNRWIGGWPGSAFPSMYFFLLPLLATLPHGSTLYSDRKTGYSSLVVLRGLSSKRFYAAKYIATFLSGAVIAIVPLLLDFYLTSLVFLHRACIRYSPIRCGAISFSPPLISTLQCIWRSTSSPPAS